jgi:hypothetical protein
MGLLAVSGSAALGVLFYAAVASRPPSPDVDRPIAPEVWWSAYALWIHGFGVVVVASGLLGVATGSIGADTLLAELPRRSDRKIVYFAYTMGAFYLSLLCHHLWRMAHRSGAHGPAG